MQYHIKIKNNFVRYKAAGISSLVMLLDACDDHQLQKSNSSLRLENVRLRQLWLYVARRVFFSSPSLGSGSLLRVRGKVWRLSHQWASEPARRRSSQTVRLPTLPAQKNKWSKFIFKILYLQLNFIFCNIFDGHVISSFFVSGISLSSQVNHDMNTLKRLLRQAETDHYALYR